MRFTADDTLKKTILIKTTEEEGELCTMSRVSFADMCVFLILKDNL